MLKLDQEINNLKDKVRNQAAANIFKIMNSDDETKKALNHFRSLSDSQIYIMAKTLKIPEDQFEIYKSIVKGESNEFSDELSKFGENNILKSGDVILMRGIHRSSQILVEIQKRYYKAARSSHVAIVQSEFVGVDAIPKVGVSMRIIPEILDDVEEDWRVIRFNELEKKHEEEFISGCSFYLTQPYLIKPSKGSGKNFSYCSELVRKIYKGLKVKNTGIPSSLIIKPCDFDKLADHNKKWTDVTQDVRDFIVFTKKYEAIIRSICKLQIDGIKLNQARFQERRELLRKIPILVAQGKMTAEEARSVKNTVKEIEKKMNFHFWNYQ